MAEVQQRLIEVLRGVSLAELFGTALPKPAALAALPLLGGSGGCCSKSHAVDGTHN
jgi:hypothetical protein